MTQKEVASDALKKLDIYSPYVERFKRDNVPCLFVGFGGFWLNQYPEIEKKRKEIEEKYKCLVYAVTMEQTEFGLLYSFLIVSEYEEEWDRTLVLDGNIAYAFAYVWNSTDEWCSEFGTVVLQRFGGGIRRVA